MGSCSDCGAVCPSCASTNHALTKDAFHKRAREALHALAKELGLSKGQYEVTSNKGGVAIMGEVMILAPWFYASWSGDHGGFFRKATSEDRYGVRFHNHPFSESEGIGELAARIAPLRPRLKKRRKRGDDR